MKGVNTNRWRSRYLFSALLLLMFSALVNWSYAHDDEAHEAEHAQDEKAGVQNGKGLGGKGLGVKACLDCHTSSKVKAVMQTPHFVAADSRSPAANLACESCHGNSSEHAQFPKNIANILFGSHSKHSAVEQSNACLGCHQGDHINWVSSTHAAEDLSCASCHTVHAPRDKMLNKVAQTKTCLSCHREQHIEVNKPYRHPVKEGAVTCTGCHNPHGSNADAMLVKATVNETCYTCHAEKRGPFVNEHEPVQDDCTHCHAPHGSNHESLLAVRPPFLCQQCHSDHSHAREAYDFEDLPGGSGNRQSRVIGGSCVNCHSQIHGSNTPGARSMRQ